MKFLVFLSLLSFGAIAGDYDKIVCQQYDKETEKVLPATLILTKSGKTLEGDFTDEDLQYEASKTPYTMTIAKEGFNSWEGAEFKGYVLSEDVHFLFKSEDKSVSIMIYLDEMEDARLVINGKNAGTFFCN